MYFYNLIKELSKNQKLLIFVDMDGVIAYFDFGKPGDFFNKRPLFNNIKILEKVNELPNVNLHILSVCKKDTDIDDKNKWLDKYAPFFKERVIISKESNDNISAKILKANYLKKVNTKEKIVLIDDDNQVLKVVNKEVPDVILYQDSVLVD